MKVTSMIISMFFFIAAHAIAIEKREPEPVAEAWGGRPGGRVQENRQSEHHNRLCGAPTGVLLGLSGSMDD